MLVILLATCEVALDRFGRADAQVDKRLVAGLEQVIERARAELEVLDT